jgi:hypothetical protein
MPNVKTRIIILVGQSQKDLAKAAIDNLPLEPQMEVVIRPVTKARSLDANAAMWAGPLKDIAEQAWVEGRQYSAEVWHEYCKRKYLPDETVMFSEELAKHVKAPDIYRKWAIDPGGNRVLIGSTTQLTPFGFSEYLTQVEAYGASMGVQFTASPRMAA